MQAVSSNNINIYNMFPFEGNSTLRPLEGAMGTPSAWPVSEAWMKTHIALDIGRWKPMM